jgi:40S ribosomal protein S4 C-terminus
VFIIGQDKPWVSLPKGKGVKVSSTSMQHALSTAHSFYSFLSPRSEIAAGL